MPFLDFKCRECGKIFSDLVFNINRDKVKCPECKGEDIKRWYEGKSFMGVLGGDGGGSCEGKSCSGCSGCSN